MPKNYRLRQFAKPAVLISIDPEHLLNFLSPYGEYFAHRGVPLPVSVETDGFDYEKLGEVMARPTSETPSKLLDALYLVDEMSSARIMGRVLEEAQGAKLELKNLAKSTPADIAVQVWTQRPDIIERIHAATQFFRRRSFLHFRALDGLLFDLPFSPARILNMEKSMDEYFDSHGRGIGTKVVRRKQSNADWFLVRHGDAFKRAESIRDTQLEVNCFRPLQHDIVIYWWNPPELRIHASSPGEVRLYRQEFSKLIAGNPWYFQSENKLTLRPLSEIGSAALVCSDLDVGIESIKLREFEIDLGGEWKDVRIHRSDDIIASLAFNGERIEDFEHLSSATFLIKFQDSRKPRSVKITPPNKMIISRDSDVQAVETWLWMRGFVNHVDIQSFPFDISILEDTGEDPEPVAIDAGMADDPWEGI